MDNPQPSPKEFMQLYGCSSQTKWQWAVIEESMEARCMRRGVGMG